MDVGAIDACAYFLCTTSMYPCDLSFHKTSVIRILHYALIEQIGNGFGPSGTKEQRTQKTS